MFLQGGTPNEWRFEGPDGPVAVPVAGRFRTDSSEAMREAVLSGIGLALTAAWVFADELDRARIPKQVEAGGSRILVPQDQVARARLLLAKGGLPSEMDVIGRARVGQHRDPAVGELVAGIMQRAQAIKKPP